MTKVPENQAAIGILVLSVLLVAVVWNSDGQPSNLPKSPEDGKSAGMHTPTSSQARESNRSIDNVAAGDEAPIAPPKQKGATEPDQTQAVPKSIPEKPNLSREEFFERRRKGLDISHCAIEATWLATVLSKTEDTTDTGQPSSAEETMILSDVHVKGDFLLGTEKPLSPELGFTLPKQPANSSVTLLLTKCRFFGKVDLVCKFKNGILFDQCNFEQQVTISNSRFDSGLVLYTNTFSADFSMEDVELSELQFIYNTAKEVFLARCKVEGSTHMVNANKDASLSCSNGKFKGPADFSRGMYSTFVLTETEFGDDAGFHELQAKQIHIERVTFSGNTDFEHSEADQVDFCGPWFKGRVSFLNAEFKNFVLHPHPKSISSIPFEKSARFAGFRSAKARFVGAEFHDDADFSRAEFHDIAKFQNVSFLGGADFHGAKFPFTGANQASEPRSDERGLTLKNVRFDKRVQMNWPQFVSDRSWNGSERLRVGTCDYDTWRSLREALSRDANLEAANEALYQERLVAFRDDATENKSLNRLSWAFWGYGVRAYRPAGWFIAMVILFAAVYYPQTQPLLVSGPVWSHRWERWKFCVIFSFRTAIQVTYGYQRARSPVFQFITVVESLLGKAIVLFFLQAMFNQVPILKDVLGKLIPI